MNGRSALLLSFAVIHTKKSRAEFQPRLITSLSADSGILRICFAEISIQVGTIRTAVISPPSLSAVLSSLPRRLPLAPSPSSPSVHHQGRPLLPLLLSPHGINVLYSQTEILQFKINKIMSHALPFRIGFAGGHSAHNSRIAKVRRDPSSCAYHID